MSTKASAKTSPPKKRPAKKKVRVLGQNQLIKLLLASAGMATLLIGAVLAWFNSLPDIRSVNDYHPQVATLILDRNNQPIDVIAKEFRLLLPYAEMPALLPKAFVAAEDSRFWEHQGLDAWSIARAAFNNIRSGRRSQGGSTITQQVTRGLLLTRKKSYLRKFNEAILSHRLERMLSKEEIIYIYLNEIYLGSGAYGVEAAARLYFGKSARDLTLGEIALLAGLPQSPSRYSPLKHPEAARARQRYVLNRMAEDGIITAAAARKAYAEGLHLSNGWRRSINGYFAQYIRGQLHQHYNDEALFHQGLIVATTVDESLQQAASQALHFGINALLARHPGHKAPQGAIVVLDSANGRIRAMIGGTDFTRNQYNRAVKANRQPGSAFKPLVYAAALTHGMSPSTVFADKPIALPSGQGNYWRPKNFNHEYRGRLSLAEALIHSSNIVAIRVLQKTGLKPAIDYAKKVGITSPLQPNLTLALGGSPVSLLELTGAYTAIANQGMYHAPVGITRVRTREGRVFPWPQSSGQQVLAQDHAAWLHKVLIQAVRRGTGRKAAGPPGAAGKTGTTDGNNDAWFVGFNPKLTAGVWIGYDRSGSLGKGETGGRAAAPVWKEFMMKTLSLRVQ